MPFFITVAIPYVLFFFVVWQAWRTWKQKSQIRNEIERIKNTLAFKKGLGEWLFILSFANLIGAGSRLSFGLVGVEAIIFSIFLAMPASYFYYQYHQPKINEVLALAEKTQGVLTLVVIMTALGLPQWLVSKTMRQMYDDGLLLIMNPEVNKISEQIFLVRTYSGEIHEDPAPATQAAGTQTETEASRDDRVRHANRHVTDMGVDEVTRRLLQGTLNIGVSGRPA